MIHLYDLSPPLTRRWIPGDQYPRALLRALLRPLRGTPPIGLGKWTRNLCLGLDRIRQPWKMHHSPDLPPGDDVVGVINGPLGPFRLVASARRCVTGVGGLNFPGEWPTFFEDTRSAFHLQSCEWASAIYRPFFGDRVRTFAVGIDTDRYAPRQNVPKEFDFLVYNKIRWPGELPGTDLRAVCLAELGRRGFSHSEIRYGRYPGGKEGSYHDLAARCRAMLFLCENETQGIAYNEAMSMGLPILAWNPGRWLDPNRHAHGLGDCPATSVPYWDERCGEQFAQPGEFAAAVDRFVDRLRAGRYAPRDYMLENLTLERCARNYVAFLAEANETVR